MESPDPALSRSRRRFLGLSSKALLLAAGAGLAPTLLARSRDLAVPAGRTAQKIRGYPFDELDSFLTPTDRFFLRSHLAIPALDPRRFALKIDGWVERPYTLTFAELEKLERVSHPVTFECSGSAVGGGMVSTAEWSGPRLTPLVERARPKAGAVELLMEGADAGLDEMVPVPVQYARSLPMELLGQIPGMLALKMNGEVLRPEHGFPVRVVLPGLYGVQHVKWVVRLTVLKTPYLGFYQTQRYIAMRNTPAGVRVEEILRQRVKSQIARIEPRPERGPRTYRVTGAAWSGGHGIQRVDISTDSGRTWRPAELGREREPYAWVLWSYGWTPPPGSHEVLARATDGRGHSQPLERDPTVLTGYVNNWCHRKTITVPG